MQQYNLTALQSAMLFLIERNDGITGYDIRKQLGDAGHNWSHQQIYRYLATMPLLCDLEPQYGKPDKKLYSVKPTVEYVHNPKLITIGVIEEHGLLELAQLKRDWLVDERAKEILPYGIGRSTFDIKYLETIIEKLTNKSA